MALQQYSLMAVTLIAITVSCTSRVQSIGVNWGTTASHPLPPSKVVELLKLNKITKVKLFDSNPQVLEALSGSDIDVAVGIPNSMLRSLNSSVKAAESWVHDNLTRYLSGRTRIEYVTFQPLFSHTQLLHFVVRIINNVICLQFRHLICSLCYFLSIKHALRLFISGFEF